MIRRALCWLGLHRSYNYEKLGTHRVGFRWCTDCGRAYRDSYDGLYAYWARARTLDRDVD